MKKPLYLDHHATTPVDPEVLAAMLPYFSERFGNAMSSSHAYGWEANTAVEHARAQVARLIGAEPREIIFTSGATESVHLAILGLLGEHERTGHVVTSPTEHKCVLEVCAQAERLGHSISRLSVNEFGQIDLNELRDTLRQETTILSLMHANNEIGTVHPIEEIGALARASSAVFHVDAAQTAGKHPIDVRRMDIDLLSLSAHKFYGPKGVGALFVRQTQPRLHLAPYLRGGGQERGLRGGTHNIPGIVGLGAACEKAQSRMDGDRVRLTHLRDLLIGRVLAALEDVHLNGHPSDRLCNNVNLTIENVAPDRVLLGLHDVAFSSASACSSDTPEGSHVLTAIGQRHASRGRSMTVRFGLGRTTTEENVVAVADRLITTVCEARKSSSL